VWTFKPLKTFQKILGSPGDEAQAVENLPSMHQALGSISVLQKKKKGEMGNADFKWQQ
jgi:hypothetical protein